MLPMNEPFVCAKSLKGYDREAVDVVEFNGVSFIGVKGSVGDSANKLDIQVEFHANFQ